MRVGLTVVGICLLLSLGIAWKLKQTYGPEWAATQDVFMGVTYFMEANDGRFPESEDEFVRSGFVEWQPDSTLRIKAPATSKFNRELHGTPITSLSPFKVCWGADVGALTIDDYGNAYDGDKKKIELLCWPSSPPSGKAYTLLLIDVWKRIKGQGKG